MWMQQNAPEMVRRELREAFPNLEVVLQVPNEVTPTRAHYVTVTADGTPVSERMWSRENIRVNVYGRSEPEVRRIASVIDAYLLSPDHLFGLVIHPSMGLIVARDEGHGGFVASVTVSADTNKEAF